MLTKILFTALVIVIVGLVFREKRRRTMPASTPAKPPTASAATQTWITPQLIAYLFVGVILTVSGLLYYLHWSDEHRLVTIRVINSATGEAATYQAYRKDIEGRRFETLDGRAVTLGDADRFELLEGE